MWVWEQLFLALLDGCKWALRNFKVNPGISGQLRFVVLINKFGDGVGCGDITNVIVTFGTWVKYASLLGGGGGGGGQACN